VVSKKLGLPIKHGAVLDTDVARLQRPALAGPRRRK